MSVFRFSYDLMTVKFFLYGRPDPKEKRWLKAHQTLFKQTDPTF